MALHVEIVDTPSLGDRTYLAFAAGEDTAVVIDPQRDIDRVIALADRLGVRITAVVETHIHNDYVTGGYALSREVGASYHVNAADGFQREHEPIRAGELITVSPDFALRTIASPGHTFTHLSYAALLGGSDVGVFTGGSLLYGATGRTDLLGSEHAETLARAQWQSARDLTSEVPATAEIWPTHGFGSFCATKPAGAPSAPTPATSTIADQLMTNSVLTADAETFVKDVLASLDVYPAYYSHMAPRNLAGPSAPDLSSPAHASAPELRDRIAAGEWVIDLRTRSAFAISHLPGSLNFGLDGGLATYLGWLIPWGSPLTLLAESASDLERAQRELSRIGIDRPAAANIGPPPTWWQGISPSSHRLVGWQEWLAEGLADHAAVLVDVRRDSEWRVARIKEAIHIPLAQLENRAGEIPAGTVWIHCASGWRASAAGSLLARLGRAVVVIDEELAAAPAAGVIVEAPPAAA